MKKFIALSFILLACLTESQGQFTKYVVRFKNKGGTPHTIGTPITYLSQRAIDRRTRYGIAIDSTDLPVSPSYVNQVRSIPNVTILNTSKWLNAVSIQTSDAAAITAINALPFVLSTTGVGRNNAENTSGRFKEEITAAAPETGRIDGIEADYFNYGATSFNEIHLQNGEFLHNIGLRGQGMQIAMMDGGFFNYNSFKAFDSANTNGQFLSTWDFVNREISVAEDDSHGMSCLSTIVANIPGQFIGKAPKASFHLFRTEDVPTEHKIEEFNWACGAERSDSVGADIISTSLGYSIQMDPPDVDHPYSDMNGNTTMAAIAGDFASKKGILVFASIGNDGNNSSYHFLSTPSDGDSVVAVGAVSSAGVLGSFSSYGPSADGQIKPDVSSVGVGARIWTSGNAVGSSNGTSFACPNMAGLGTCLWQGFPEFNNMKIVRALQQSGSIASAPDNRIGYGYPDMKLAFSKLLTDYATSSVTENSCNATLTWITKDVSAMRYEIERKVPGELVYTKVGDVPATAGVILANKTYNFNNAIISPTAGTVSYRIRQIIDTNAVSFTGVYIDTANVNIASGCFATGTGNIDPSKTQVSIQPNPVHGDNVTLVVQTPGAVNSMPISVFDEKGRLVMQMSSNKSAGVKSIQLNTSRLGTGKYYIRVMNGPQLIGTVEMLKL